VFSRRALNQLQGVNAFSLRVETMRRQDRLHHDLTTTNPTSAGIPYDWESIRAALAQASFEHYVPNSLGAIGAREQLTQYLERAPAFEDGFHDLAVGGERDVARLMLTASTSEAYGYLFKLLCEAGESILVPTPSYPLIERLAAYENVRTIEYKLVYDGAWHLDRTSVLEAMAHSPRTIVVVSPNNPTASCLSSEDFTFLAQLGVPLIVDQVFAPYVARGGGVGVRELHDCATLTFVLDGLSKRCGLPQLKLGWVSVFGPKHDVDLALTALAHLADTYLSVNRPAEAALGDILRVTSCTRQGIKQRLATNLSSLLAKTQDTCVTPLHYQGGWTVLLRLPGYQTDEEWAVELLERGVLVQPGWLYDVPIVATLVVSLLTPCVTFDAGLDVLCGVLGDAAGER
jgi:alanine-synthesizing transaminase